MPRGTDRYDEARLQGRLWTPDVLRGSGALEFWVDASDLSTISTATGVSQLRDKSGKGRHWAQATGASQPTLGSINGRPALAHTTSHWMASTWTLSEPLSLFVVYQQTSAASVTNMLKGSDTAGYTAGFIFQPRTTAPSACAGYFISSSQVVGTLNAAGSNYLQFVGANGASGVYSQNGATRATMAGSPGTGSIAAGLSTNSIGGNVWSGIVGEIIVTAGIVSVPNQQKLEGSSAWKWGLIDNLPASHPYKNRPPLIGD